MRKTATVTIEDEGRDKGKVFVLTEMPASQAERWANQVFFHLAATGIDVGDAPRHGIVGIAIVGLKAIFSIPFDIADPLLNEMFGCVAIKPSDRAEPRPLVEEDIQEVTTRWKLRGEVLALHAGFSSAVALWEWMRETAKTVSQQASPDQP